MAVCTAWVEMDVEPRLGSSLIAKFVVRANRRSLQLLLDDQLYFLKGWENAEFQQDQAAPELHMNSFKSCFPSASGHLALREDWLETIGNAIKGQTSKDAFDNLIKNHNGVFGIQVELLTAPLSRKRAAEAAEASKVEGFSVCENVNASVFLHHCILYRFPICFFRFSINL